MAQICKINLLIVFFIMGLAACDTKDKELNNLIAELEVLHCQAARLKDSRFELSDLKRNVEVIVPLLQNKLDSIDIEAEKLKKNSLELANVIKSKTDYIIYEKLKNEKDQSFFNEKINQFGQNCKYK